MKKLDFDVGTWVLILVIAAGIMALLANPSPPAPIGVRGTELSDVPGSFDEVLDADEVRLIRNSEDFPSFVLICHEGNAYISTRSRSSDGPQTPVLPDPQRQEHCQADT